MAPPNPALQAFIASFESERVWAQVLIERTPQGFRLRHVRDREKSPEGLKPAAPADLRKISTFTADRQFRPLRAAPDLPAGWVCVCPGAPELWRALQELYPGSVPDWFAARQAPPPVTHYREFTGRQTGMYRITQLLTDAQAGQVIAACCHPRFCLKQRLWSVECLAADLPEAKSSIPCLEPCAVLLELSRKAARIEQEEKVSLQLAPSELESILGAVRALLDAPPSGERAGNISSPANPRRLQVLLEKLSPHADSSGERGED